MLKIYLLTSTLHHLVELAFNVQLWVFGFYTFQLDGNLFTSGDVGTWKNTHNCNENKRKDQADDD